MGARPLRAMPAQGADDGRGILRYAPSTLWYAPSSRTLEPVSAGELKPGYIYSHFSRRLNRRVWSYLQENGEFWYACGEGTTQEAWRLGFTPTAEEEKLLQNLNPTLYGEYSRVGLGHLFLRLTADNQWVAAEGARFPTIYNAETGQRWEKHYGKYIPISSAPCQYQWDVEGGRYVPRWASGPGSPACWTPRPPSAEVCR
jgi:hypothetical protein